MGDLEGLKLEGLQKCSFSPDGPGLCTATSRNSLAAADELRTTIYCGRSP